MLYPFEIMERICFDLLPFCKNINNLVSTYIITSDHISSILFEKIKNTEKLIYTNKEKHDTSLDRIQELIRITQNADIFNIPDTFEYIRTIEYTKIQLRKYIKQNRKLKYTLDKGGEYNFNYYKLKSKLNITQKEETEEEQKYFNYLLDKY